MPDAIAAIPDAISALKDNTVTAATALWNDPLGSVANTMAAGVDGLRSQGVTVSAKGSLLDDFGGGARSSAEMQTQAYAAARGMPGDQGGHLVGYRFLPEQGGINQFPQQGNFNMGTFKTVENDYARYLNEGYQVDFEHTLQSFNSSWRPNAVRVEFTVTDSAGNVMDSFKQVFSNAPAQTYVRRKF